MRMVSTGGWYAVPDEESYVYTSPSVRRAELILHTIKALQLTPQETKNLVDYLAERSEKQNK